MKILYVEDNPANVFLVKRVARMGKHEIINYIDGDQALAKFDEIDPTLVLMDIQLAGNKSGLDVVKILRERGIKTPIIAVTAYAMVGDKERCIAAGCTDYLAKPLPIQQLVKMFEHYSNLDTNTSDEPTQAKDVQEAMPSAPKETASNAETVKATNDTTTEVSTDSVIETSPKVDTPTDVTKPSTDKIEMTETVEASASNDKTDDPILTDNNPTEHDETQEITAAPIVEVTNPSSDSTSNDTVQEPSTMTSDTQADIGEKS